MFSFVVILCLVCVVRSADLRSSQREVRDDADFMVDELFRTKDEERKDKPNPSYDTSDSGIPRILSYARDMTSHYNPCRFKIKEWNTVDYLNQKTYDFQPDRITVKHCIGGLKNTIVKQGCMGVMDCVTQYERRRFLRKLKGTPCTHWHLYEKEIPVGCECMMAT